jgi:hypothetical protein
MIGKYLGAKFQYSIRFLIFFIFGRIIFIISFILIALSSPGDFFANDWVSFGTMLLFSITYGFAV